MKIEKKKRISRKIKKNIKREIFEYEDKLRKTIVDIDSLSNHDHGVISINLLQFMDSKIKIESAINLSKNEESNKYFILYKEELINFPIEIDEKTHSNIAEIKKNHLENLESFKLELLKKYSNYKTKKLNKIILKQSLFREKRP